MQNAQDVGNIDRLANLLVKIKDAKKSSQNQGDTSSPKLSYQARREVWEKTGRADTADVSRQAIL